MTKDGKDGTQSDQQLGVQVKEQQGLETEGSGVFREEEGNQYDQVGVILGKGPRRGGLPKMAPLQRASGSPGFWLLA